MTAYIWLVAELTIAKGKTEFFKSRMKTLINQVQAQESDTLIFQLFFNDDETKCYPLELYKDSEALTTHIHNVRDVFKPVLEVSQLTRIEIYGNATEELKEAAAPLGAKYFTSWDGFSR